MLCLLLLLEVQEDEAFFTGTGAAIALTPGVIGAIVAAGVVGKLAGIATGVVLQELGRNRRRRSNKSQTSRGFRDETRRRKTEPHNLRFASLGISEPEECFRRVFCAAATGK